MGRAIASRHEVIAVNNACAVKIESLFLGRPRRRVWMTLPFVLWMVALANQAFGAELNVGPDQPFAKIEEALAKAQPGDTLLVHALPQDQAYEKVALLIRVPNLTLRALPDKPGDHVRLSGAGFDYSGDGRIPRAIVQFDPSAQGCTLDGFELFGAHNASYNGAGVRINQANDILVTHCEIHDNDMGIMSNGNARAVPPSGDHQRIEHCLIHHNGATSDPGYNHNLYLGGTSVTLFACEVHSSLTGHNVKSRPHLTRVIDCFIHDSAAREIDLVDEAGNTDLPGSDALVLGNVIVKSKDNLSNHTVVHFGQDVGHDRTGTIYLAHNTIVTPFISPVVDLSTPHVRACFIDNLVWDGGSGQKNQLLVKNRTGGNASDLVTGQNNLFCGGFGAQGTLGDSVPSAEVPPFTSPGTNDYHLSRSDPRLCGRAVSLQDGPVPKELLLDTGDPLDNRDLGAFAFKP